MSALPRLLTAPGRLLKALRREGAGRVVVFLLMTVRKKGVVRALQFGLADRNQRELAAMEEPGSCDPATARAGRPDLDPGYGLAAEDWAAWAPLIGGRPASADPYDDAVADVVVRYVFRADGGEPTHAGAQAAAAADWVVFLKPGDTPSPELPRELARAVRTGVAEVVSFDMARREGGQVFPILLPGANPTLLRAADYTFGRFALRSGLLTGEARLDVVDPRSVVLGWAEGLAPEQVRGRWRHVGRPVVDVALSAEQIRAARDRAARAPPPDILGEPVSVVICTRDKGHLTRQLVRGLLARPPGEVAEVVIVANGTANACALQTLSDLAADARVQVLRRDEAFNFSRLANAGARATRGSGPILFLNDDIVPVSEDWLERLVARLAPAGVGAVGPLLLYPDERVQHAGMYLGFNGLAGHTLRGAVLPDDDYLLSAIAPREVSSLTGAVLLVRRCAFEALNGFDEQLATYLQDVDLCLRLMRSGWCNVFDPGAVLLHMESVSIRRLEAKSAFHQQREREKARFVERWGDALGRDAYHPTGFDPQDETLRRLSGFAGARPGAAEAKGRAATLPFGLGRRARA